VGVVGVLIALGMVLSTCSVAGAGGASLPFRAALVPSIRPGTA